MKKEFLSVEKDGFYGTYYENPKESDCVIIGQHIRLHFVRISVGKFLRKLLHLLVLEQLCKEALA